MQLLEKIEIREIYQEIKHSLQLKEGFGLFFIVCNPSQAEEITKQIKEDFRGFRGFRKIETLILEEEVAQLHEKIVTIQQQKRPNILLISGIEKSLEPYVKSGDQADPKFDGLGGYYQLDFISLPPLLTHLNLQRESYKHDFPFALVFFLSPFAYRFFVRRAPDFFDWRSGIFKVQKSPQQVLEEATRILEEATRIIENIYHNRYLTANTTDIPNAIRRIKQSINEPYLNDQTKKELYFHLGLLQTCNKDNDYAIQSFDKAIEIEPEDSITWNNRGIALKNLARYEEANQSFDLAIKFKPDYSAAWVNRGNVLRELGRHEKAIESFDQAIKFQSDDFDAWNGRGITLRNLARYEEAIESFNQAIKIQPDSYYLWNNKGNTLSDLGKMEEAIASYDKALEFKPDLHEAWNNRGNALHNLGKMEEAIKSYDKALEIQPDDYQAYYNKGVVFQNLGKMEEAIDYYDKALEIKSDLHEAWYHRGIALRILERYEDAIKSFNLAIEFNFNDLKAKSEKEKTENRRKEIMNEKIKNRDYTLIIDKSKSMGKPVSKKNQKTRWKEIQDAVIEFSEHLEQYDPDGLTIYTFGKYFKRFDNNKYQKVTEIFATEKPSDNVTNTAEVVEDALNNYFERKNSNKNGNKTGETIFVITDGEASDTVKLREVIIRAGQKVKERGELGISFLQVGDEEEAINFLKQLDDNLESEENPGYIDIVDVKTFKEIEDNCLEFKDILIGALDD